MDYKEKYEQALERARQFSEKPYLEDSAGIVEYIFPELKESEDEKIRKWCISHFKECINVIKDNDEYKEYLSNKVLAWLEKQGEQNLANSAKTCKDEKTIVIIPKFRVGDVIRPKGSTAEYTIESISGESYHGKGWGLHISCDNDYELVEQKPAEWSEEDDMLRRRCIGAIQSSSTSKGVKKELVDWLKSLKDRVQLQPRQEWSEDDEEIRKSIIDRIERRRMSSIGSECAICENQINWLKSLSSQSHWKPSESDILLLERIANGKSNPQDFQASLGGLIEQLKKLREE